VQLNIIDWTIAGSSYFHQKLLFMVPSYWFKL